MQSYYYHYSRSANVGTANVTKHGRNDMATKRKKRQPRSKRNDNPEKAIEAFLASVPESAALPDDIVEVVDKAAKGVLLEFPKVAAKPRALRRMVRRRVIAHYRDTKVGWEFDEEKCRAFMDLLIEYLPLFIALLAPQYPAIAAALAA